MLKSISQSWKDFDNYVVDFILKYQLKNICEIGAGVNPVLTKQFISDHNLYYTIVDIDAKELQKGDNCFEKKVADFSSQSIQIETQYDLIITKMTLEHISSPEQFHRNVYNSLKTGGFAIHFFAT